MATFAQHQQQTRKYRYRSGYSPPPDENYVSQHPNYAAMPDLPEEARKLLFTVEKIVAMGKGTLVNSIWATPEEKRKAGLLKEVKNERLTPPNSPDASPALPLKPNPEGLKASYWATASPTNRTAQSQPRVAAVATESTKPKDARILLPHMPGYVPPHLRGLEPKHNASVTSTRSTSSSQISLNPKAEVFVPFPARVASPQQSPTFLPTEPQSFSSQIGEPKPTFVASDMAESKVMPQIYGLETEETSMSQNVTVKHDEPYVLPHLRGRKSDEKNTPQSISSDTAESKVVPRVHNHNSEEMSISQNLTAKNDKPYVLPHLRGRSSEEKPVSSSMAASKAMPHFRTHNPEEKSSSKSMSTSNEEQTYVPSHLRGFKTEKNTPQSVSSDVADSKVMLRVLTHNSGEKSILKPVAASDEVQPYVFPHLRGLKIEKKTSQSVTITENKIPSQLPPIMQVDQKQIRAPRLGHLAAAMPKKAEFATNPTSPLSNNGEMCGVSIHSNSTAKVGNALPQITHTTSAVQSRPHTPKSKNAPVRSESAQSKPEMNNDDWFEQAKAITAVQRAAREAAAKTMQVNAFTHPVFSLNKNSDSNFQSYLDQRKNAPLVNAKIYTTKGKGSKQEVSFVPRNLLATANVTVNPLKVEDVKQKAAATSNNLPSSANTHIMRNAINVEIQKNGTASRPKKPKVENCQQKVVLESKRDATTDVSTAPKVYNGQENVNPLTKTNPHSYSSPSSNHQPSNHVVVAEEKTSRVVSSSHGWDVQLVNDAKVVHELMMADLKAQQHIPKGDALTENALAINSGFRRRDMSNSFDARVSDAGVGEESKENQLGQFQPETVQPNVTQRNETQSMEPQHKAGVLWTQGKPAAEELLDWDGSWLPAPCDWEERTAHNTSYMRDLINEWLHIEDTPSGPEFAIETRSQGFVNGLQVMNGGFQHPFDHDIKNSEDEDRRLNQTASTASTTFVRNLEKRKKSSKQMQIIHEGQHQELAAFEPGPDPFAPKIDVYLRPATKEDASGVATIYNQHVTTTFIPEDQAAISQEDIEYMIENARNEKHPFIVAVRGKVPTLLDVQGRPARFKKDAMPKYETVIGFATAETYNYGISGGRNGRSRTTLNLMLYIHPEYKRKGVGRNLLDRLVHNLNSGYAFQNACPWLNPEDDPVHESGGAGSWHQLTFHLPVFKDNDPNLPWVKRFLQNKFLFSEETRLPSVARSCPNQGPATFLDLVIFRAQAAQDGEFDAYV
ncbi:hypothetical protein G7Y89_g188 [Cudoniella acicularis]|uniref:N-acetyltransferase domain-containing protein n=1 Tax=Cudoniella acicularis TaxID=354080 RepID=A0A8H4RYG5_9HELO|nr:hypothetical protein G7Y89_g188 [Cudoniella acicularis]